MEINTVSRLMVIFREKSGLARGQSNEYQFSQYGCTIISRPSGLLDAGIHADGLATTEFW